MSWQPVKRAQHVYQQLEEQPWMLSIMSQQESLVHRYVRIQFTQAPQHLWLKQDQFLSHEEARGGQPKAVLHLAFAA